MDNLSIHSPASLYEAFPAAEAKRRADRLAIHYTPKHGSWRNMAAIEPGIRQRHCLDRPAGRPGGRWPALGVAGHRVAGATPASRHVIDALSRPPRPHQDHQSVL
jgi:hypothetical protein